MRRIWIRCAVALVMSLPVVMVSRSAVIETTISYIGSKVVYLNAGSGNGVANGDSAQVWREEQIIARLEIVYVAQSSSSAKIITSDRELKIGDKVRLMTSKEASQDSMKTTEIEVKAPEAGTTPISGSSMPYKQHLATRIHGRVAAQIIHQDDREASNNDATKPALVLRTSVENFLVDHLSLSVNLRARRILYRSLDSPGLQSNWDNRLYEFTLRYDNPASPVNYQMGRISSNRINGIGLFDGAMVEYRLQNGWSTGIFGGTRPDLATSAFNSDETTGGLYAAYETSSSMSHQVRGTLAFAGRYHTGVIDQEFAYEQIHYIWSRDLYVFQSAEMDINRGWRRQAEGSAWSLSNMFINASYSPTAALTFDAGYDNRKLIRTYETKNVPDSLFDDAMRQGFRLGVSAKMPLAIHAWLRLGLRTRANETTESRTLTAGLNRSNIFNSGVAASGQFSLFKTTLSSGDQESLSLARYFFQKLYLQLEAGKSRYEITSTLNPVNYHWFDLSASSYLMRHLYASSYVEIYRGEGMNTNRFSLELGYQF